MQSSYTICTVNAHCQSIWGLNCWQGGCQVTRCCFAPQHEKPQQHAPPKPVDLLTRSLFSASQFNSASRSSNRPEPRSTSSWRRSGSEARYLPTECFTANLSKRFSAKSIILPWAKPLLRPAQQAFKLSLTGDDFASPFSISAAILLFSFSWPTSNQRYCRPMIGGWAPINTGWNYQTKSRSRFSWVKFHSKG